MNPQRWQQIEQLYHSALERDEAERPPFLLEAASGDEDLLREVESLLAYAGQAEDFMVSSTLRLAGAQVDQARLNSLSESEFGAYRVLSLLGSGGMGEVYLAEDRSLGRKVALKLLSKDLELDETAKKRLLREAKAAAALDHPYVCNIFEVGEVEGRSFIALEYVEGQTLASRLQEGPLPLDAMLQITAEVAEALDAAHARKIVHRDLKPSNIMLARNGHAKVMDFGVAKRLDPAGDPAHLATSLTPATPTGFAMGTPAYMSPEQLRARKLDGRSDIFSFGVVCYEMVTGIHPFQRPQLSDTISSILKEEPPPLARYRDGIPELLQHMIRKMLAKDPASRYQSAHEIRTDTIAVGQRDGSLPTPTGQFTDASGGFSWKYWLPWALLPFLVLGAWLLIRTRQPDGHALSVPQLRFSIQLPPGERVTTFGRHGVTVSPDGSQLAFVGGTVEGPLRVPRTRLYLRRLDQVQMFPLPGTENALNPVFSPNGEALAFVDSETFALKRVALDGDEPVPLCQCMAAHGLDWDAENSIIFGSIRGLQRVSASGGDPELLTQPDEATGEVGHFLPHLLPGGNAVLFTVVRYKHTGTTDWKRARIFAASLKTGERKLLIENGSDARYVSTGHILFAREGELLAAPFNPESLVVTGAPSKILSGVNHSIYSGMALLETGAAQFSLSNNGLLVYLAGSVVPEPKRAIIRVDRQGNEERLEIEPKSYVAARLSPDGKQVLLSTLYPPRDIWLFDLERKVLRRQTFEGQYTWAIWGPRPEVFTVDTAFEGADKIYLKTVNSGPAPGEELETGLEAYQKPSSWSPDGNTLAVAVLDPLTGMDIWVVSADGKPKPLLQTRFAESYPEFSPDGRWLAYTSDESGRSEVYLRPYPGPGSILQVSIDGGFEPGWSPDGTEIYYRWNDYLFAAKIRQTDGEPAVDRPIVIFEKPLGPVSSPVRSWDVGSDGRFLLVEEPDPSSAKARLETTNPNEIQLVQNWFEELRRPAPTDR